MDAVLRFGVLVLSCLGGGLLTLIGGAMILAFVLTVYKGLRTRFWPATFGRVISSGVMPDTTDDMPERYSLPNQAKVAYITMCCVPDPIGGHRCDSSGCLLLGRLAVMGRNSP